MATHSQLGQSLIETLIFTIFIITILNFLYQHTERSNRQLRNHYSNENHQLYKLKKQKSL